MPTTRPRMVTLILLAAMLACTLPGSPSEPTDGGLETAVAATLTSGAPSGPQPGVPGQPSPQHPEEQPPLQPATQAPPIQPSPAPAVLRIVYTDGGNVWLIEGAQPPIQLTSSGDAEEVLISSDGMKIAFIRRIGPVHRPEIRSINHNGSGELTLLTPLQIDTLYPLDPNFTHNDIASIAFVPGTHDLMFNTRAVADGPGLFKYNDLVSIDADSGTLTTIFVPGDGGDFTLAPDGSRLALVQPTNISLADVDGTSRQSNVITYSGIMTYSEFQYYVQPVWTWTSTALGVAIPSADPLASSISGTIWRLPADGSAAFNLSTINGDFYFTQGFSSPSLSYNLQRVAFMRETGTPNIRDLTLADADGSGEVVYATGKIGWIGWAPDSVHFVYSLGDPMNLQLGIDGGLPGPLGTCTDLRWVDNVKFLCLSGSMGSWTLMLGQIGVSLSVVVSPSGDFVNYDFDR